MPGAGRNAAKPGVHQRPPGFEELADDELAAQIRDAIEAQEADDRRPGAARGRRFVGRRAILRASRYAYAQSRREQFGVVPAVAGRTGSRIAAIERLRAFRVEHALALAAYRAGDRDVVFPHRTWNMRVYYSAAADPRRRSVERPAVVPAHSAIRSPALTLRAAHSSLRRAPVRLRHAFEPIARAPADTLANAITAVVFETTLGRVRRVRRGSSVRLSGFVVGVRRGGGRVRWFVGSFERVRRTSHASVHRLERTILRQKRL